MQEGLLIFPGGIPYEGIYLLLKEVDPCFEKKIYKSAFLARCGKLTCCLRSSFTLYNGFQNVAPDTFGMEFSRHLFKRTNESN